MGRELYIRGQCPTPYSRHEHHHGRNAFFLDGSDIVEASSKSQRPRDPYPADGVASTCLRS